MKDIPAAHRVAGRVRRDVVELAHFDGRDVSIFGETGGHQAERGPLVGRGGRHVHFGRGQDEVGLADRPGVHVREIECRRHVGRVALRRPVVDPGREHRDFVETQRRVVLELLDAQIAFDEPGRHGPARVRQTGARLDRPRPRPHLFVGDQRHRRHGVGPVALLATALEYRRDVPGERHLGAVRLGDRGRRHRECRHGGEDATEPHDDPFVVAPPAATHGYTPWKEEPETAIIARSGLSASTRVCGGAQDYRASAGRANAVRVAPDGISTCCRPSSMKVMAAAPQIGLPV